MPGRSAKTGNVLSTIESQGFRIPKAPAHSKLKLMPSPPGNAQQRLKDASSQKSASKRTKGQPEGSAVTGKTRKLRVAEYGHVSDYAADHNNSNLTPRTASAASGEWELILTNSSHYCFYPCKPVKDHKGKN
jgi:hypothetical protein